MIGPDKCWKCGYSLVGGTCDNGCITFEENLRTLDRQGIRGLFDACREYHSKHSRGPGAAAICVCGWGGGGSVACRGLAIVRDVFRYADFNNPKWVKYFEFVKGEIS